MRTLLLVTLLCLGGCKFFAKPALDFDKLNGTLTEAQAMALLSSLNWQCSNNPPPYDAQFGQRVCDGLAEKVNDIPTRSVDYHFRDGTLSFALIDFNPNAWAPVVTMMDAKYKRRAQDDSGSMAMRRMLSGKTTSWVTADGVAVSSETDKRDGNIFMLWISNKELARAASGH
jgi:hypothetical protein